MRILVRQFDNSNHLGSSKKVILVALLLLFMPFKGLSQNESTIISKSEFETGISQGRSVIGKFKSYSKSLNPAIYIDNSEIRTNNANPTCLHTDYGSLPSINGLVIDKKGIEYASIRIQNQGQIVSFIRLTHFSNFADLKYIHLIFEYEVSDAEIEALIKNPLIDCYIIYESRKIM